jgi:hypothetical protein
MAVEGITIDVVNVDEDLVGENAECHLYPRIPDSVWYAIDLQIIFASMALLMTASTIFRFLQQLRIWAQTSSQLSSMAAIISERASIRRQPGLDVTCCA